MPKWPNSIRGLVLLLAILLARNLYAGDKCDICRKDILGTIWLQEDKVTHTRYFICSSCLKTTDVCYLCSRPVPKNSIKLPDSRVLCERDARTVIIDENEAAMICRQVKQELDTEFARFITFPDTNVTIGLMDRVKLQELYKIIGNDFTCPDTRGCTESKTNNSQRVFEISILSGQRREDLITTCVHEYGHTWINENVGAERRKTLGKDAVEGFCELLAYLHADNHGYGMGKSNILGNAYTRGQIHAFIEAHARYGFLDIVDWLKHGEDAVLRKEDLSRIRRMAAEPKTSSLAATNPASNESLTAWVSQPPPKLPNNLILQGILWSPQRPMATINGQNFFRNETATVRMDSGRVQVQCLEIQPTFVLVKSNQAPVSIRLELKSSTD